MYMSMQELTSALREASVAAASENHLLYDQPPSEICILRLGYLALSCFSWLKLPASAWSQVSVVPATELPASQPLPKSAQASPAPSPALGSESLPAALLVMKHFLLFGSMLAKA